MQKLIRQLAQSTIDAQDAVIKSELASAGIPAVTKQAGFRDPVSCTVAGKLAGFDFNRLAECWIVVGTMSHSHAAELRQQALPELIVWLESGASDQVRLQMGLEGLKIFADFVRSRLL